MMWNLDESLFFFVEYSLLAFIVFVGGVDECIKCVVQVLVLHRLPHFFHHDEELLSDHVVDPQAQNGDSFVGLLENLLLGFDLMSQRFVFFFVCSDLIH